jgi:hypothetical protein
MGTCAMPPSGALGVLLVLYNIIVRALNPFPLLNSLYNITLWTLLLLTIQLLLIEPTLNASELIHKFSFVRYY